MIGWLALSICTLAFCALALATERHQMALFDRHLSTRAARALRIAGWCGLALALWLAVFQWGWALGLVHYSGHTSVAAGLVHGALIAIERRRHARQESR